jgi:hypothetical protein
MIKVVRAENLKSEIICGSSLIVVEISALENLDTFFTWTETLAGQLASLLPIESFHPMADREQVLKSVAPDRVLKFIMKQSKVTAAKALRWLGFRINSQLNNAWREFLSGIKNGEEHNELSQAGLICRAADADYYPLPVLTAASYHSPDLTSSNVYRIMARFRRYSAEVPQVADAILNYLRRKNLDDNPAAKNFGLLTDPELLEPCLQTVECLLSHLDRLRRSEPHWFEGFAAEQMEIWRIFTTCSVRLKDIKRRIYDANLALRPDDYIASNKALSAYLDMLADAYGVVTEFENYWGIDKLLAPHLLKQEVDYLRRSLQEVRTLLHMKIARYREHYQEKWGIWGLSDMVRLLFSTKTNIISTRVPFNGPYDQKRVFVFVLDGYGMVQHLWGLRSSEQYINRSFSMDIFSWLEGRQEYNGKNILGSTLATDTGSGLAAIFTGSISCVNGVLGSKMWNPTSHRVVDVLKEGPYQATGRVFKSFFDSLPDNIKIKVFHGGGRGEVPTPFGRLTYGGRSDYFGVNIAERIFALLLKSVEVENDSVRHLYCIYHPLIDRTGHSVGSFSNFELNEIKRFKSGLLAFLIDLAYYNEEVFDGKTTFLFTADHGMFETSERYITVNQIRQCLNNQDRFIWTNRSIWIYSDSPHEAAGVLSELFKESGIAFEQHFKGEHTIGVHFGEGADVPDLIIQFTDEGLIAPSEAARTDLLLFGVHGGRSNEEVFVPCISLCLTPELGQELKYIYKIVEG